MEKAILSINGKDYELRFTAGFWKRIKVACDVTNANFEQKLQEDFGEVAPKVILASVIGEEKPTLEDIEESIDRSVMDVFETAIINGMTKAELQMIEIAKKMREDKIKEFVSSGEDEEGKK